MADTTADESVTVGDISVRPLEAPAVFAQRDLSVNLEAVHGGAWTGSLVYATDLFDESTMAVFARRLRDYSDISPDGISTEQMIRGFLKRK